MGVNSVHLIAYVSELAPGVDAEKAIDDIVTTAKKENARRDITGALFFMDNKFLQVLEGDEMQLRQLLQNIEADKRHRNVHYIINTRAQSRGFSKWNMDSFNLDSKKKLDVQSLKDITESFRMNLLPRSDMLVFYYKTLLARA